MMVRFQLYARLIVHNCMPNDCIPGRSFLRQYGVLGELKLMKPNNRG